MKIIKRIIACAVCALVLVFTPLVAYKKTTATKTFPVETPTHKLVLTIWNVDTFEGGVGSRTDFLSQAFLDYGKKGVLAIAKTHTKESAEKAIKNGERPDILSFGAGFDGAILCALELPEISFKGGEINGKTYAYPWCVGGYFLITKTPNNQLIDRLFISQNAFNLPFCAMQSERVECKEKFFKAPLDAYVAFVGGRENDALLGTQRDLKRLTTKKANFYAKPIGDFSDIVQYVAITVSDRERYGESLEFIEYLLGEKTQKKLSKIGMYSPFFNVYDGEESFGFDFSKIGYTVSPFTQSLALSAIIGEVNQEKPTNDSLLRLKNALKRL